MTYGKSDLIVALQPHGDLPPFFCLHGVGGDVLHLYNLAMQMGSRRPFLGVRRDPNAPLTDTLPQIAGRYVEAILAEQPSGPDYLGGHSFGATAAYEVARQLVEQGHEIGLLVIIDQRRPGWRLTFGKALPVMHRILGAIPQRMRDEWVHAPQRDRLRHFWRLAVRWSKAVFGYRERAASMFIFRGDEKELIGRYDAHLRAIRSYQAGPLRASLTLIRAETQLLSHLALDSTLGWKDFVEGEVRVRIVPGDHHTMATEPLVSSLPRLCQTNLMPLKASVPCLSSKSPKNEPMANIVQKVCSSG